MHVHAPVPLPVVGRPARDPPCHHWRSDARRCRVPDRFRDPSRRMGVGGHDDSLFVGRMHGMAGTSGHISRDSSAKRAASGLDYHVVCGRGRGVAGQRVRYLSSASAAGGGRGQLELPVDEPISRVFDDTTLPGVQYRLELVNTTVSLWWIFLSGVSTAGPPTEIVLGDCPRLIPSILAYNLQGTFSLPAPWPIPASASTHVTFGNLTLRTTGRTVRTWCWGLYLSGEQTDAVLQGPTSICELFLSEGRLVVAGDADTYNSANACTTVRWDNGPSWEWERPDHRYPGMGSGPSSCCAMWHWVVSARATNRRTNHGASQRHRAH